MPECCDSQGSVVFTVPVLLIYSPARRPPPMSIIANSREIRIDQMSPNVDDVITHYSRGGKKSDRYSSNKVMGIASVSYLRMIQYSRNPENVWGQIAILLQYSISPELN